jgi:acetylornithine deacetylase/succinyl-diaminopimelate desuccinylase-like protein
MDALRAVIDELAVIPRLPTSAGEREAAYLIRNRLAGHGCRVVVEEVRAYRSYAWPIGVLSALGAVSAVASLRGHRLLGAIGGAIAAAGIVDDITSGAMVCRRVAMRAGTAYNVVAETGDPAARRTLVVLAHHDAAPSGLVFDQTILEWLSDHRPDIIAAMKTNPPLWWPAIATPILVALGGVSGRRWLSWLGLTGSLGSLATMVDIGRRPAVPGANDNLSGVAAIVALAERLAQRPISDLRVLLVSAGAEEALQEGIRGFARNHFRHLDTRSTWFLNLDTVGSGRLVLLEGEGPVRMHDYDRGFKDLVAKCAADEGIEVLRGLRSRNSTDGTIPHRHGYRTATVVSVDGRKLIPHYHLESDRPEHLDYTCIENAVRLAEAIARRLATR